MNKRIEKYFLVLFLTTLCVTCIKKYDPPAIQAANNYLVVDGLINANANEATTITLSRTRNLNDTVSNIPELNAQVYIVSNTGNSYALADIANTGNYTSALLNLSTVNQYQLKITTSDGHRYLSDFVPVKKSAPIDSLTWQQDSSLTVYLSTHDPTNSTIYYKWDFIETWELYSPLQTFLVENNGLISFADTTDQIDSCWITAKSANILTGTSVALAQDIISRARITTILQNDIRIKARYSILVRQIPLTAEAYNYWLIIQKNSQQLGTLFDLQPSQLTGNIHPLTNPGEPVIGYVTAAVTQQKRLFISHNEVSNWSTVINHQHECDVIDLPQNPLNPFIYNYPDTSFAPWYFSTPILRITKKECIDCREYGGVNVRPSFW